MTSRFIKAMGSSAIALLLLWNTNVSAQDAPKPQLTTKAPAKAGDPDGFEEIIVTARRREERLQDVPVAATAFTAKDLERYQSNSFEQIAAQSPQLQIGTESGSTGGAVINLRGVGSPSAGPSIDNAVSINIDGIQFSQSQALRLGLNDIERVEILKGPQALFYGKNSPAGVISIITKGPGDKFEGSLRAGYEFANKRKYVEGTVSGPLSDSFGARLDLNYGDQSGYFRNDAKVIPRVPVPAFLGGAPGEFTDPGAGTTQRTGPDQKDFSVRGTLAYKAPSGFVDGTIKVSYGKVDRNNGQAGYGVQFISCPLGAPSYVVLLGTAGSRDCTLDRNYNEPDIPAGIRAIDPRFNKNGGKQFYISNQFQTSATLNFHPTDTLTLTSVTGHYNLKEDYSGNFAQGDLSFVEPAGDVSIKQFSQELRLLSSFKSPLNFMIGGYYQHVNNRQTGISVFGSPLIDVFTGGFLTGNQVTLNNRETQITEAYSVFGQAIADVTPQIQLTAGGRYSHEKKSQSGDTFTPQVFTAAPLLNVPFAVPQRSFNNFSPEFTATYKPARNLTVYAAYRTAFKSGGYDLNLGTIAFGARSVGDNSFDQEKVKGFEIGAKGSLADHQIVFDFDVYRFKYTGLQSSAFDATTIGYRITNAASAIVQGAELSAQYRPKELVGLSFRGSINHNDAHYDSFANAPCYSGQSIVAGCNSNLVSGAFKNQNLTGRPLTRAPKWTGNLGATYEFVLPGNLTLATSADGIYTGSFVSDSGQDPRGLQRNATRLNAAISLRGRDDRWELALIGTNLNQQLRSQISFGIVGTGFGAGTAGAGLSDLVGSPSEVRTVSLQAKIKF